MLEKNPDTVKLVFKNFPLQRHHFAAQAAQAALAAHSLGKFWAYHDRLFENFGKLDGGKFIQIARELGVDEQKFAAKMKDPEIVARVRRDAADGQKAGVGGTPTIFINGRLLKNRTLQGFQVVIDKELARLGKSGRR